MIKLKELADAHQTFEEKGYVLFRTGVAEIWILELLAEHYGSIRGIWGRNYEVTHNPKNMDIKNSVSQSFEELPPHTDGTFEIDLPKNLLLQCIQNDIEGFGVSVLIDGWKAIDMLSEQSREVLLNTPFEFFRSEKNKTVTLLAPILEIDGDHYQLRYRNDRKHELSPPSHEASIALKELAEIIIHPDIREEIHLIPGDVVYINNQRMLHGRTHLSGKKTRRIRRFWVQ